MTGFHSTSRCYAIYIFIMPPPLISTVSPTIMLVTVQTSIINETYNAVVGCGSTTMLPVTLLEWCVACDFFS